jgi:hypothetical protein
MKDVVGFGYVKRIGCRSCGGLSVGVLLDCRLGQVLLSLHDSASSRALASSI